ncbi:MAG TPA: ABC transporter ATP-binding protein [Solirubrobacteraceae bacterium]|jgi:ABC-2 type transport system ATP-binding protein|nr:ABC transporter ATP-binding protein [Solirubrobacteraceae bacterium]
MPQRSLDANRSSGQDAAIETTGLTKRFGERTALDGVDLHVPRGSAFGFLGPNGAGKTTMIRTLLGLTHASAGSMTILGEPVPERRAQVLQRVGAIVEEPRFHMHLSGRENLLIVAAVRGAETRERIDPALARVGLGERADDKVKSYSMGMRQRLGVARCLLADPLLLILDEPTNGLDPGGIQEFREMIRAMVEDEGRTVFISSHLLDEVEKTCDAAAIVDRGKVIAQGAIADLAGGGTARHELIVGVDDAELALGTLGASALVREARRADEGIRVVLAGDPQTAAQVNAALVAAGVGVTRLEPVRHSLEQRFLQITQRLDAAAEPEEVRA